MIDPITCLTESIGISATPCVCYDDGKLAAYQESPSGYFMDHAIYGLPLSFPQAVADCDYNNLWDLCVDARRQGAVQLLTELGMQIQTQGRYTRTVNPASGTTGGAAGQGLLSGRNYVIQELSCNRAGATIVLEEVQVKGQHPDTTPATAWLLSEAMVAAGDTSNPLATFTGTFLNQVAVLTPAAGDVTLDFKSHPELYLVWSNDGAQPMGMQQMERSRTEGCCSRKRTVVADWVPFFAIEVSYADAIDGARTPDPLYTGGMTFTYKASCDIFFDCSSLAWGQDPFARVIAELMVLFANEALIAYILQSNKANVYTGSRSPELIEKQEFIRNEIPSRLSWAAANLPEGGGDCYTCNPRQRRRSLV